MARLWIQFLWMACLMDVGHGLQCYICTFMNSGTSRDMECVTTPWNVTQGQKVMDCPYPYCVIYRQTLQATKKVNSYHRGCEKDPRGNNCKIDAFYSTCSYTCVSDFCNGGDGIPLPDEIGQDFVEGSPKTYQPEVPKPNTRGTKHKPTQLNPKRVGGGDVMHGNGRARKPNKRCLNPYLCDQSMHMKRNGAETSRLELGLLLLLIVLKKL